MLALLLRNFVLHFEVAIPVIIFPDLTRHPAIQGAVQKVVVVLRDESGRAVEKFVIQVGPLAPHAPGASPIAEIEEALRAVLMKVSVLEPPPGELPKGAETTLCFYLAHSSCRQSFETND